MSRRARKKEVQEETDSASERLRDRISLALTLVVVSAFAIFTGYLVGQYAISWIASPLITEPISSARQEAASTQFREEEPEPAASTPQVASVPAAQPSSSSSAQAGSSAGSPASRAPASPAASTSSPAASPAQPATGSGSPATGSSAGSGSGAASQSVTMHRVQVGRYATRSEAEAVAQRLRTGRPAVPDAWVLFDQAAGVYRVQAGAFTARERALELAEELSARGYEAFVVP